MRASEDLPAPQDREIFGDPHIPGLILQLIQPVSPRRRPYALTSSFSK